MTDFLKYSTASFRDVFDNDNNKVDWIPMDTETLFKQNCQRNPDKMKYWIDNPFSYTINKYGFRTSSLDTISDKAKIMTVGCSFTFGIGMPEHGIWPKLLADKLNMELYNLGTPGGGADSVHRIIKLWFDQIRPDLIVWFFPVNTEARYERFDDNRLYKFGPWDKIDKWYMYKEYRDWMIDKNIEAIKYIIRETPIVIQRNWYVPHTSYARDLDHRGFKDHKLLYKEIHRKVENNEYT